MLWSCIDYRGLNNIMVKNCSPNHSSHLHMSFYKGPTSLPNSTNISPVSGEDEWEMLFNTPSG